MLFLGDVRPVRVAVRRCSPLLELAAKQTLRGVSQELSYFNRTSTALTGSKNSNLYPVDTLGYKKFSWENYMFEPHGSK